MVVSVLLCGASLRAGLVLRRTRRFRAPRLPGLRETHLRLAKPAVIAVLLGFLGGPLSAVLLRNWAPFRTFHGAVGLVAAALFAVVAALGLRLERRRSRRHDAHALLGLLAMLAAVVASVAGFVLLP